MDPRKSNQYTGFSLKGWAGEPTYTETGAPVWNAPAYGDWKFGAAWSFGDYQFNGEYQFKDDYKFGDYTFEPMTGVEWGEWDALPGENPDDCLRSQNADKITKISNVIDDNGAITPGEITDGAISDGEVEDGAVTEGGITEGDVSYGDITSGELTPNGPAKVFVNGKALAAT